ncbi:MAG: 16S rRNA (cytidine(1402)-2'-O)-methyltransferase [Spirochaetia bacterium]|nr:16S rRNA (cytidine(1402)-2'-O)-methyltransferase [Spirochaetia bacterium]
MSGKLYIVATPIGNLEDITYRAVRTLKESDYILCEDTRKTHILCKAYDIQPPLKSFRIHRMEEDMNFALSKLNEGLTLSLCTDAGTPSLSDPGSHLVRRVRAESPNTKILPIPGPSALTAALSVCGFRLNPMLYAGFLSIKSGARKRFFESNRDFDGIIVFFESVHRISKVLKEVRETLPDRPIFMGREMTKAFEEYRLIDPNEQVKEKGEFTIVLGLPGGTT